MEFKTGSIVECSEVTGNVSINLSRVWGRLTALMYWGGEKEWFGMLGVQKIERGASVFYNAKSLFIPKQICSGTSAEPIDPIPRVSHDNYELPEGIDGIVAIHSHHTMGAFHSSTDDKSCTNFLGSIVLSIGKYPIGVAKTVTPCGKSAIAKAEIICPSIAKLLLKQRRTKEKHKNYNCYKGYDDNYYGKFKGGIIKSVKGKNKKIIKSVKGKNKKIIKSFKGLRRNISGSMNL